MEIEIIKTTKTETPLGISAKTFYSIGFYNLTFEVFSLKDGTVHHNIKIEKKANAPSYTLDIDLGILRNKKASFVICSAGFGALTTTETAKLISAYNHAIEVVEILNNTFNE